MKASERRNTDKGNEPEDKGPATRPGQFPWVSWIAIFLGVTMVLIGLILTLWGFAWQTGVGEASEIDGGGGYGGPGLIPFGIVTLAIGLMWILTGWNRFRKARGEEELRSCPYCGKRIEKDLNFCYYCNRSFKNIQDEEEKMQTGRARSLKADRP